MPSTSLVFPAVGVQEATAEGTLTWTDPDHICFDNGQSDGHYTNYAGLSNGGADEISERLVAREFPIDLPEGEDPTGITIEMQRRARFGDSIVEDWEVYLRKADGTLSANLADGAFDGELSHHTKAWGAAGNLWGFTSLTRAELLDPDFSFVYSVKRVAGGGGTLMTTWAVRMAVHYGSVALIVDSGYV